ncbi:MULTISPECIES: hypothetical protein [unclassified Paenibacillus]|uniref:hypothetical protein n=1 Tax=unclassified Paenibacillus TaxID=185978 RepID=UPI00362FAF44
MLHLSTDVTIMKNTLNWQIVAKRGVGLTNTQIEIGSLMLPLSTSVLRILNYVWKVSTAIPLWVKEKYSYIFDERLVL